MRKHSYLSPSLRQWLIVSSVQRDGNSLSPLIPFLYAVLPRGESKECVLPLLRQRSVCCRCCDKGVRVAAVAAKECVLPLLRQRIKRTVCCRCSHTKKVKKAEYFKTNKLTRLTTIRPENQLASNINSLGSKEAYNEISVDVFNPVAEV
jgi:hypothetical protein